jgi:hypothetical protein
MKLKKQSKGKVEEMKINLDLYSESPGFHPLQGIACFLF